MLTKLSKYTIAVFRKHITKLSTMELMQEKITGNSQDIVRPHQAVIFSAVIGSVGQPS